MFKLFLILISFNSLAVIIGEDNRVDTIYAPAYLQQIARSVPALIQNDRIKKIDKNLFQLEGIPLHEWGLCSEERFSDESNIANCSGSLIGKDKVLTAAHCMDGPGFGCDTYSVVFDYQRSESLIVPRKFSADQIYRCKKVLFSEFDPSIRGIDLMIIQLDREVIGREPVKLDFNLVRADDSLTMIGYPLGISQKVVEQGTVLSVDKKNVSFKHDLDTFSVNSGGPIFSASGEQVGVLVRGTGPNLDNGPQGCSIWGVGSSKDFAEANDLSRLKSLKVLKL